MGFRVWVPNIRGNYHYASPNYKDNSFSGGLCSGTLLIEITRPPFGFRARGGGVGGGGGGGGGGFTDLHIATLICAARMELARIIFTFDPSTLLQKLGLRSKC